MDIEYNGEPSNQQARIKTGYFPRLWHRRAPQHALAWQDALPRWAELMLLALILIVATCFRLYRLGQVPPGPHYDEAANALDALDVLDGRHTAFSLRSYGREMLGVYVAAPFVAGLGPTLLALRLPVAVVGILTVLATYLLARELFFEEDRHQAKWTALGAALFLALSFWHLALNHLSFRANYLPLVAALCFFFMFRALRTGYLSDYVLSGFFLGLGLHTYIAARFVPILIANYLAVLLLGRQGRALVLLPWRRWALMALVALVISAPLVIYFLYHPEDFLMRARGVSVFASHVHQGEFWKLLARSVLGNVAQFGFRGDENWLYNIPGRPGLDPIQAILFWLGVVLCLVRWRQPRYLFLLLWWWVMLLPSILAPVPIPHSLRSIGTLPVACILAARALAWLPSKLPPCIQRRRAMAWAPLVLLVCYLAGIGYHIWHSYFHVWAKRDEVYYAYYGHIADLADQINRDTNLDGAYIFPVNYDRRGEDYHEYTLELLHRGPVPFHYLVVDDSSVAEDLTGICAGKRHVHLIHWTHGDHVDADPRQVLPFFLQGVGQKIEERAFRGYRIATYELTSPAVSQIAPPELGSSQASFSAQLKLVAQSHDPSTPSGGTTLVALRWQAQQAMAHDYKASLRLLDTQEHRIAQSDTLLLSNDHRATSSWEPGQIVTTYHLLPVETATLPGAYVLELVVYDPDNMDQIPLVDPAAGFSRRLALGSVEIGRPAGRIDVEPETPLAAVPLAPGIELIGYAQDKQIVLYREVISLAVYWLAQTDIAHDHAVVVELVDATGEVVAEWVKQPVYPTSLWQAGDLWREWYDLTMPTGVPMGKYHLAVSLTKAVSAESARAVLGTIEVQGRDYLFEVPAMDHPRTAQLGERIRFLGYNLEEREVRAGETLSLTLYWQAVTESDVSYTVFTHLLDAGGRIRGQSDGLPAGGALPTTRWQPQEVIADHHDILVSAHAVPGEYLLEIGMYEAASGQRLPIRDEVGQALGDHLLLDSRIQVMR